MKLNIAKDYSMTPGGRFIKEGLFSGEDFRRKLLSPKYKECVAKGEKLEIILDGAYGYATSFLEEAFGGLARELKSNKILDHIILISEEDLSLPSTIEKYVKEAIKGK